MAKVELDGGWQGEHQLARIETQTDTYTQKEKREREKRVTDTENRSEMGTTG